MDLFLCSKEEKNIIVNLTFIIKLHEVAITFTEYCSVRMFHCYAIYPAGDDSFDRSFIALLL